MDDEQITNNQEQDEDTGLGSESYSEESGVGREESEDSVSGESGFSE